MQKKLTLQQLVSVVGEGFRQLFEEFEFWVEAEISAIKPYKSRLYCELIQADSNGAILAQAKGIIWEPSIMQKFLKNSGLSRQELVGTTVLLRGVCSFHSKYGRSIGIREVSAEYTRGVQLTHREKVIQQLQKDGLWQVNQHTDLPLRPLRCAVISGRESAGYEDFQTTIDQSGYAIHATPYWSAVEGNNAIQEVAEALKNIQFQITMSQCYDCIVIVRGGGSKDGFLWQDDYVLGKLIGESSVPVIIGIGHTRDQTLLDQTVFFSAKTPTEVAYYLVEHVHSIETSIEKDYEICNLLIDKWQENRMHEIEVLFASIVANSVKARDQKFENIEEIMRTIRSYDPTNQLEKGRGLITTKQGVVQKGALAQGKQYILHHGTSSYTIRIEL